MPDARRAALLDAAIAVFARFGYRKTSMDEVARAAGVSRQGLYLIFSNKEELFRKALVYSLSSRLDLAIAELSRVGESLEQRLVSACDAWSGRYVGALGDDASDLVCAGTFLAGAMLADYEARFEAAIARSIAETDMARACGRSGHGAADFARALHATARGLKQISHTRAEFVKGMTVAARLFCTPLHHEKDEKEIES